MQVGIVHLELQRGHQPGIRVVIVHHLGHSGVVRREVCWVRFARGGVHEAVHGRVVIPGHALIRAARAHGVVLGPVVRGDIVGSVEFLTDWEWTTVHGFLSGALRRIGVDLLLGDECLEADSDRVDIQADLG